MNRFTTLPASLLALALAPGAHAQDDEIYEMITTAIHVRRSETALPVTVLSDKDLHDAARSTLGETLAGQPGINTASFGPAVGQTVIRGQQGRRVMNLSNGMPNADASGNSADHAQTVEAILANAIEVLRGPSTLLYGGGAIGGVVNVIDRRIATNLPDEPSFAFEARHDSAADLNTAVGSLDFATGSFAWHVDGLQRDWNDLDIPGLATDPAYFKDEHDAEEAAGTRGHIANTGGETSSATGGVTWIFAKGHAGLAVSTLANTYGLPSGAHGHAQAADAGAAAEEEQVSIDMERTRHDFDGEWQFDESWLESVHYRLSHTDYQHAELEGPGLVGTRYHNDSWQQRLQLTHTESMGFHGVLGLQHSNEEFGARGAESFIPVSDIDSTGLFAVEDFHTADVTWEFGARVNRDAYRPHAGAAPQRDFATTSLSASALWDVSAPLTFGLSVSRSQRAPSVEELYSNHGLADLDHCVLHYATGACEIGSAAFEEETSVNTDLTAYLTFARIDVTFTAFHNTFSDYIGQVASGADVDGFPVRYYRQLDARFSGIEVDVNVRVTDAVALRLFGDTIKGRFDDHGAVPRMPTNRIGTELTLTREQWSAHATLMHGAAQDQPGAFELPTDAWTRLDIGVDYTVLTGKASEVLVFVKGRNLGDAEIRLSTSHLRGFAPEAGRSVEAGVRYRY